jgi:hypothetical protein
MTFCLPTPPFFGPVSSILSLKSNIGSGLVFGGQVSHSSEGTVTRQQSTYFESHVPGDLVRDPCNPDEDGDLITDYDEVYVTGTDPLNPDTAADGMPDGYEHSYSCLNPLINDAAADPDNDGQNNLAEYGAGTNPCSASGAVGGIAEPPDIGWSALSGAGRSSAPDATFTVGAGLGVALLLVSGGWYLAKRRRADSVKGSPSGNSPDST